MYHNLQPIDPTTPKGLDELIEELIYQQYQADFFVWMQIERFSEIDGFLESVDAYHLCNWNIIYSLLGLVDVPDDLKLMHGHIARRLFQRKIESPVAIFYADMILDNEKFMDGRAHLRTNIQQLISMIKGYKK